MKLVIAIHLGQLGAHDGLSPVIFIGIFLQMHFEAKYCLKRVPHKLAKLSELPLGAVVNQEISDGCVDGYFLREGAGI